MKTSRLDMGKFYHKGQVDRPYFPTCKDHIHLFDCSLVDLIQEEVFVKFNLSD